MARAVARSRELRCHNCNRQWRQLVWGYDEHWNKPREPITCTCDTPHVEILSNWKSYSTIAQCRASQRAVIYYLPDGSTSAPPSNAYDDPVALDAVAMGGVRHEFPTVRSMIQFQRERAQYDGDEYTDRCMVIDHDQPTIISQNTLLHSRLKQEDAERAKVLERSARGEVYFGGEYYERARAAYERSHGRRH